MCLAARVARSCSALAIGLLSCLGWPEIARSLTPEVNFQLQCMGCHLRDGSGQPGRVPSFRRTLAAMAASPQGREYLIRVPGVAQAPLCDEDIAALLNWMVRHSSDYPVHVGFKDFSAAEVHRWRARPLTDVSAARMRIVRLLSRPASAGPNRSDGRE